MRKYEIGFIIKPTLDETANKAVIDQLKAIYTSANCEIIDELDLGVRELAYEIEKHKSGYYFFLVVNADSTVNKEFERICRISEDVIRFMVVNIDGIKASTLDTLRK
ncbi:MAG: 30S ribosomal protein S6 [Mycoplasmatales bacterium]